MVPDAQKNAATTPKYKKVIEKTLKIRPVSLTNIESQKLQKFIFYAFDDNLISFLQCCQLGFVKKRSLKTKILWCLKGIYEALDKDASNKKVAF